MVNVVIPTVMRRHTEGDRVVAVEAATVQAAMEELGKRYPSFAAELFEEDGSLRSYINLFVNDTNIRDRKGPETPLNENDEIIIVPALAGG